ncbi:MAG: hypothetical protein R3D67_09650 [Hyphomicrobiaceae bacterium]
MAGNGSADRKGSIKGDAGRAERLAQQLRENLVRRKAQNRRRAAGKGDAPADLGVDVSLPGPGDEPV